MCVLIKDIGRRFPLELQCSYQGQQGDVSQSVRGNCNTRLGGQNLTTAVEGNASAYQVYSVSRITGEGRADFLGRGGLGLNKRERGGGEGGRAGQLNLCVEPINLFRR